MIIWLASYPRSGNTWVRSFLSSILFSQDEKSGLINLHKIKQYPLRSHFKGLINDYKNINDIVNNWSNSQDIINLDGKIKIIKTHHLNCKINDKNFTNLNNTLGVIYIVRDPRNVITSLKNHFSRSIEESKDFLFDDHKWLGVNWNKEKTKNSFSDQKDNNFPTLIGSWKNHYNLWKNTKNNFLLIKFEDLVLNPNFEFMKIISFLKKFLEIDINKKKLENAIKLNSFKNHTIMEETKGFKEALINKKTGEKIKFFYLGPENDWKKLLDKKIATEIESEFNKEMKELGYL